GSTRRLSHRTAYCSASGLCQSADSTRVSDRNRGLPKTLWPLVHELLGGAAHVRWRHSETPTKLAVEGGKIAKAGRKSDVADSAIGITRIGQHTMHAGEALAEHKLRQRRVLALEQLADVAGAHVMTGRQGV